MTNFICFRFLFKFLESSASQFRKRTASKFHKKFPEKSATTKLWSSLFTVDTVDLHAVWCLSNKNRLEYFAFAKKVNKSPTFPVLDDTKLYASKGSVIESETLSLTEQKIRKFHLDNLKWIQKQFWLEVCFYAFD